MRFTKVFLPDGNTIIDTGLPQRAIKPAGLELHTHMIKQLYNAAEDNIKVENGAVRRMCKFLVNTILDMSKRDEARENIDRLIEEALGDDNGASLNFADRTRIETEIWLDIGVQEMMEYLDQVFAVSHRVGIGTFGIAPQLEKPQPSTDTDIHEEWKEPMDAVQH